MADNSVLTEKKFKNIYNEKIYPFLNGATHTGCVPLGTILPYFGETAPTHFLICDGTEYAKSDYPELAEHLLALTAPTPYAGSDANHFKVPDLRGEFLRGAGTNSHANSGNGSVVGKHQSATIHEFISVGAGALFSEDKDSSRGNVDYVLSNASTYNEFSATATHKTGGGTWSGQNGTSRPTNTSVTYIIAYRNAYIDLALDSFPIDITQPTDGQLLMYDATAGRWVNGGYKYSTDEHIVGTWSDGRPLYEKTFEGTTPNTPNVNQAYDTMTLPSGYNIKNIFGTINSEWQINTSYTDGSTISIISTVWFGGSGYLIVRMGRERECSKNFNVTVQYTKTTDTV